MLYNKQWIVFVVINALISVHTLLSAAAFSTSLLNRLAMNIRNNLFSKDAKA